MRTLAIALAMLLATQAALAGHMVKGYYRKDGTYVAPHYSRDRGDNSYHGAQRDADGRIRRSEAAKYDFKKSHPCPSTGNSSGSCPGYVIDHITPLKRGGADDPRNMQWQTVEEAKEKDRWE